MSEFMQKLLDPDELKIRWEEPYVSAALNRKLLPQGKGIFRGFIPIVNGNVVELHLDSVANDSVGVVETQNHYSVLIYLTRQVDFDFTGHGIFPVWIVLEATYDINTPTTGRILVVDETQLKPWHTRICKINSGLVIDLNERDEFLKFSTANPEPVGAASSPGTVNELPRRDHVHEGVHKIIAGSNVSVTPANGLGDVTIDVTLPPAGIPGHKIYEENTELPQRNKLKFISPVITVVDDAANDSTKVQLLTGTPTTLFAGGSNSAGSATTVARSDHVHAISAGGTPSSVGSSNYEGASSSVARADHVHRGVSSIQAGANISVSSNIGDVIISTNTSKVVKFPSCAVVKLMGPSSPGGVVEMTRVMRGRSYYTRWVADGTTKDMDDMVIPNNYVGIDTMISDALFQGDDGPVTVPDNATSLIFRVNSVEIHGGIYFFIPGRARPSAVLIGDGIVIVPMDSSGQIRFKAVKISLAYIFLDGYII